MAERVVESYTTWFQLWCCRAANGDKFTPAPLATLQWYVPRPWARRFRPDAAANAADTVAIRTDAVW